MRRFRVEGDVEFGRRGDVAVRGDRAAHDHEALDPLRQGRIELERQRDVGQRAERDQQQFAGVLVRQPQDRECGVLGLGRRASRRVPDIAEAVAPMHVGGIGRRMQQRIGAAGVDRHVVTPGDFAQLQGIAHGVLEADVAGGDGQADAVRGRDR